MIILFISFFGSKGYLIGFLLFLLTGFFLLICLPGYQSFLFLNNIHTLGLDNFFLNITFLGDGIFALMVFFFLLLIKKTRPAIEVLISFICSGLLAQFLKFIFHAPRPKAFLEASQYSKFFEGVTNSGWNSFPSGHTTTAFAVATILAFYSTNTRVAVFYLLLALLVGYSRIYLGHHFLEDVLAGAVLGLISSCLVLKLTKNNSYTFSKEKKLFIE